MSVEAQSTRDAVYSRLDNVLDPCSCTTANPVSIVDLGLVEDVQVEAESVEIRLLPTSPMCLYMGQIMNDAKAEVMEIDGVENVDLEAIDATEKMWRPERLADDLKEARDNQELMEAPATDGS